MFNRKLRMMKRTELRNADYKIESASIVNGKVRWAVKIGEYRYKVECFAYEFICLGWIPNWYKVDGHKVYADSEYGFAHAMKHNPNYLLNPETLGEVLESDIFIQVIKLKSK